MAKLKELEKDVQKVISDYFEYLGAVVIKINNVGIFKRDMGTYIPPRTKGVSDLIICYKGQFIAIECKGTGGKVSPYQEAFIESVRKAGGKAGVARSLDEALEIVK